MHFALFYNAFGLFVMHFTSFKNTLATLVWLVITTQEQSIGSTSATQLTWPTCVLPTIVRCFWPLVAPTMLYSSGGLLLIQQMVLKTGLLIRVSNAFLKTDYRTQSLVPAPS